VCLGQSLLKQSRVLVLDKATASVDTAIDGVVQIMIRSKFSNCIVIIMAHRIHSVIDSDLVLVLSEGNLIHLFLGLILQFFQYPIEIQARPHGTDQDLLQLIVVRYFNRKDSGI
jgi:ABC-type multidrug transport system ATPase subunit